MMTAGSTREGRVQAARRHTSPWLSELPDHPRAALYALHPDDEPDGDEAYDSHRRERAQFRHEQRAGFLQPSPRDCHLLADLGGAALRHSPVAPATFAAPPRSLAKVGRAKL